MQNAMPHHKITPHSPSQGPGASLPRYTKISKDTNKSRAIAAPPLKPAKQRCALGAGTAPVKIGPSTQPKLSQTLSAQNTKMPTPLQPCPRPMKIPNLRTPTHFITPRSNGGTFEVSVERRNGGTYEVSVERQTGGTFEVSGGNGSTVSLDSNSNSHPKSNPEAWNPNRDGSVLLRTHADASGPRDDSGRSHQPTIQIHPMPLGINVDTLGPCDNPRKLHQPTNQPNPST